MLRRPFPASAAAIIHPVWAHCLATIAQGLDGVWVHPNDLARGPHDTADRLFVEIGADEPDDMAILLREVAKRVKRGEAIGEESHCLGTYAFLLSPWEKSTPGAAERARPPWTRAMGEACVGRLLATVGQRSPHWMGLEDMRRAAASSTAVASPLGMAQFGLEWMEEIPVEVLPYLSNLLEGAAVSSSPAAPVAVGHAVPPPVAPAPKASPLVVMRRTLDEAVKMLLRLVLTITDAPAQSTGPWVKRAAPDGETVEVIDILGNERVIARGLSDADAEFLVVTERAAPELCRMLGAFLEIFIPLARAASCGKVVSPCALADGPCQACRLRAHEETIAAQAERIAFLEGQLAGQGPTGRAGDPS